jgi:uncharacterized protein (TIGR02391 family)
MATDKLAINKLKVRRAALFAQLKIDFEQHYEGRMHFDIMSLANLYCEYRIGLDSKFSSRAAEIEELDQEVESLEGGFFWPKWRAIRLILNHLIQSGRLSTDEQFAKAAKFLTQVEDVLSGDKDQFSELEEDDEKKRKESEKLVCLAELLHPWIIEHAFQQYRNGHLRDAVLNAFISVGDLLRERSGIALDGSALATSALSLKDPKLVLSELDTESGRNDQIGFMQIIQGAFTGIRNPKAHSVRHELTEQKAGQYLVLASLLARRITEASVIDSDRESPT